MSGNEKYACLTPLQQVLIFKATAFYFLFSSSSLTGSSRVFLSPAGRQIGLIALQEKLKTIKIPDLSGSEEVSPIGKVSYGLTG